MRGRIWSVVLPSPSSVRGPGRESSVDHGPRRAGSPLPMPTGGRSTPNPEGLETAMAFALYELAKRQDLQDRTRQEIEEVLKKHEGKISYEAIQEMKYLDQVINETLRMYPPVAFLTRKCIKDYKVPDEDLVIEKKYICYYPGFGYPLRQGLLS